MKYIFKCLFIFVGIGSYAQETPEVNTYSSTLSVGEVLNLNNRTIVFKNVVSDSRCPKDVTCVWAGEAKIAIDIYEKGRWIKEQIINIESTNIPLEFSVGEITYSISNLILSPHPTVKKAEVPVNYVLQMSVREIINI